MIISASRRTDIPAFYAEWFINRLRAGYCTVPNPFNPEQVSQVSLKPEDVDVIVFWTRNPRPLIPHLAELDERGYRYYFQYPLLNNPPPLDPKSPPLETSLKTFQGLARHAGPERVIWRYDPIVFTTLTSADFHQEAYTQIAKALRGYTHRSVISLMDLYPKTKKRLSGMAERGAELLPASYTSEAWFPELMQGLVQIATDNAMEIVSCAEEIDLAPYGVRPGKCVDDEYIQRVFGIDVTHAKDPSQRRACGCVVSNKPAKIENAGSYWIMCRRPAGARSGKPGTFSKRGSNSCL
jgi:hypothetical protein